MQGLKVHIKQLNVLLILNPRGDNSEKYIAELNRVLKHRGQDISMAPKFPQYIEIS